MGLVVNHELANLRFADILDELDLGDPDAVIRLPDESSCGVVPTAPEVTFHLSFDRRADLRPAGHRSGIWND